MLTIALLLLITVIALPSLKVSSTSATRLTALVLASNTVLAYHGSSWLSLGSGISLYSGLLHATPTSYGIDLLLGFIGAIAVLPWAPLSGVKGLKLTLGEVFLMLPVNSYYSLLVLFSVTGSSLLVSSNSLMTLYLGLELQSFAVYVLAGLYRESEASTNAGLTYFLLGGLSSAFILLGSSQLYAVLGVMSLEEVYSVMSIGTVEGIAVGLSLIVLASGLYFKLAAAPFHQWAPTVYDGVPTIITTWLQTMPKLAVLGLLLELTGGLSDTSLGSSLMVVAMLSMTVGSLIGLAQSRIKPLLTYSTVSHVGFMLLALATYGVESVTSFSFYLAQYSITSLATLLIVLAFGYQVRVQMQTKRNHSTDMETLSELTGQVSSNPMLCLGLGTLLFSIAGVPPFIGFYGKLGVLESSVTADYTGVAILAILASAISASYYLKVVKLMYFNAGSTPVSNSLTLTATHTFTVSFIVLVVGLYMMLPTSLLDSIRSMALSVYNV